MGKVYRPGERLPSIRSLHQQSGMSISTVYQAYVELETRGAVEARPKSGYYVLSRRRILRPSTTPADTRLPRPRKIALSSMINSIVAAIANPRLLPLGMSVLDAALMPHKHLHRIMKDLSHGEFEAMVAYSPSEGHIELKRQLALRVSGLLDGVTPGDILITNGCMEAVALCLLAVAGPGGTVAIEAPTNFGFLQMLNELGVMAVEVPTDPRYGVDPESLERILLMHRVGACLLMPNFHNPLGATAPDENKQRLIQLINHHRVAVIEDDVSSDLFFDEGRPAPLKAYDTEDRVLLCSSFSKTLAPGFRIGWVIAGDRFKEKLQNLKAATTVSTSTLDQHIVAKYLAGGTFERHMRFLRRRVQRQMMRTATAIRKHFPPGTGLALPRGGSLLWVRLPPEVDGAKVYRRALAEDICIVPGGVCANSRQFTNYIQISCGLPFTPRVENGLRRLGHLITELSTGTA